MQNKKCLKEIIPILRHTYKSIDIRAIAAQPKNKNELKCIFLKIRLIYADKLQIEKLYRTKKKQLGIENVFGECRNINQLDHLIEEIQKGEITINGFLLKLDNEKTKNILDLPIQKYEAYSTTEERSGYNHWFVFTSNDQGHSTFKVINDLELSQEDLGIDFDMINYWFDIDSNEWENNTNYFVLLLPIYIKRIEISKSKREKILIKYSIHKDLLKVCTFYKIDHPKTGFPTKTKLPYNKLLNSQNYEDAEFKILLITIRFISPDETVKFELVHNTSYKLFSDLLEYKDVKLLVNKSLSKKSQVNYLQRLIIETAKKLDYHSYSRSRITIDPFEMYIYHLLSPIFPCIWIGLFENINELKIIFEKEGFTNLVDFIVFDKNSIMIIECTRQFLGNRSIVGEYEIGKLTHVKAILEKFGYKVNAILICLEPYTNNPSLFNEILHRYSKHVHFIFKEGLEEIEAKIYTTTNHEDILKYSRNYK